MKTRPGVTLLEVLVSIFIMGIGMIALLTLFPLGATTMAQAMKDARTYESGDNAKKTCFAQNIMHDPNVTPYFFAPDGKVGTASDIRGATGAPPTSYNGPSYPVYVDPIGVWYIGLGTAPLVANFPRTFPTYVSSNVTALRWYSLADDYQFDPNSGSANLASGVERESRYTWAYLMKLPNVNNPTIVDVNVVVYGSRNLQVPGGETPYSVISTTGSNTVVLGYTTNKPNIKRGGWVLDVTPYDPVGYPVQYPKYGPMAGIFYRVVDATDVIISGKLGIEIELQSSLPSLPPMTTIMVMDNVAEVYPIGPGWRQ